MKTIIFTILLILGSNFESKVQKHALKLQKNVIAQDTTYDYCINLIKRYEKFVPERYELFGRYYIGYGHMVDPFFSEKITEIQADSILRRDFNISIKQVNSLGLRISYSKRYLLSCFVFNCGIGTLRKSKLLEMLKNKDDDSLIKNQYLKYCYADGKYISKLLDRRSKEFEIIGYR